MMVFYFSIKDYPQNFLVKFCIRTSTSILNFPNDTYLIQLPKAREIFPSTINRNLDH